MRKLAFAAVAAVAMTATAAAPIHLAPGQWEATTSMHFSQGGIQIPPEIRQQMEARGMQVPDFSQPHTYKSCLTPEEAARDLQHFTDNSSCKTTNMQWSGEHFHAELACTVAGGQTHGVVDGTLSADGKSYAGTMRMEGDQPMMGGHFVMEGQASGKWLGPTCDKTAG